MQRQSKDYAFRKSKWKAQQKRPVASKPHVRSFAGLCKYLKVNKTCGSSVDMKNDFAALPIIASLCCGCRKKVIATSCSCQWLYTLQQQILAPCNVSSAPLCAEVHVLVATGKPPHSAHPIVHADAHPISLHHDSFNGNTVCHASIYRSDYSRLSVGEKTLNLPDNLWLKGLKHTLDRSMAPWPLIRHFSVSSQALTFSISLSRLKGRGLLGSTLISQKLSVWSLDKHEEHAGASACPSRLNRPQFSRKDNCWHAYITAATRGYQKCQSGHSLTVSLYTAYKGGVLFWIL